MLLLKKKKKKKKRKSSFGVKNCHNKKPILGCRIKFQSGDTKFEKKDNCHYIFWTPKLAVRKYLYEFKLYYIFVLTI